MHVTRLRHDEVVRMDIDRLQAICNDLGAGAGETAICNAMEDIAVGLETVRTAWETGDLGGLRDGAAMIGALADSIGMIALSQVAGDAERLCRAYDDAALGAVMARLARIGEQSLLAVWDAQNQSV